MSLYILPPSVAKLRNSFIWNKRDKYLFWQRFSMLTWHVKHLDMYESVISNTISHLCMYESVVSNTTNHLGMEESVVSNITLNRNSHFYIPKQFRLKCIRTEKKTFSKPTPQKSLCQPAEIWVIELFMNTYR